MTADSNISNFLGFFLVSRKPLLVPRYCVIDLGTVQCLVNLLCDVIW